MSKSVLVLGASGRFGRHAANAFGAAGWSVRQFRRGVDHLAHAANGADVIVNAWNPPYTEWQALLPDLTRQVIDAAQRSGATVVIPGNVYVFGPDAALPWSADTPHWAENPLGRARCAMEAAFREAKVPTLVLRGGDFLDTEASGNWFDRIMIKSLEKGVLTSPGDPFADHAWAYLPDMARACVNLMEQRDALPVFCDVPFAGYSLSASDMAGVLSGVLSGVTGTDISTKQMAWWPIQLLRPIWPMARHLLEMRYLWSLPHRLDPAPLDTLLPEFESTPVAVALHNAVQGAGFAFRSTQTSR